MDIYVLDKDGIIDNVNQINHNINNIDEIENRINKKRQDIYSLYVKLEKKKYLNLGDSINDLKFQLQLITHENSYLKTTKDIFINKVSNDLFDIGENVIMVVSSMDDINLEYQGRNEKDNIMKKIIPIKKLNTGKFGLKHLLQLITSVLNNLDLIKNILDLFDNFINTTSKKMETENFHCRNLSTNLRNQRSHLILEYNNLCESLEHHLKYYQELSNCILVQIQNHKLIDFCTLNKNQNTKQNTKQTTKQNTKQNTN